MNRREFISKSAAVLALSSIAGSETFAAMAAKVKPNKGRIGIQLYSIRRELPNDFVGSLKKLADMGYSQVETYGFNSGKFLDKYTMKDTLDIVKDMGMSISGMHTGSRVLTADTNDPAWDFWKRIIEYLKSGGGKWAIQASFPGPESPTMDDLKRICDHFNRVGELCKKNKVKFGFHNHVVELGKVDNVVILDYLIKNTDPKLVFFQLDMGHLINAGGDCVNYLKNYPKRIPMWHASDFISSTRVYTEVGKGSVPYPQLFDLANSSGLECLTVEQETDGDIFGSCKFDFDYLKQFKWTKV